MDTCAACDKDGHTHQLYLYTIGEQEVYLCGGCSGRYDPEEFIGSESNETD